MVRSLAWLCCMLLCTDLLSAAAARDEDASQAGTPSPNLQVSINLLEESLRAGDCVPVDVWLANLSELALNRVDLHLEAPSFLGLASEGGGGPGVRAVQLGAMRSGQTLHRRLQLCAGETIREADFNLLFVLEFRWTSGEEEWTSFKAVEKELQTALLGTATIGGFSLRLVAFIVPGLLFWMLLRLFRVPHASELGSGESAALAVLTSAVLIAVVSAWKPHGGPTDISFLKLGLLCALGGGAAILIGVVVWFVRFRAAKRAEAQTIRTSDNEVEILKKVLARSTLKRGRNAWLRITRKDGGSEELLGSAFAETGEGKVVLVGWYQIEAPARQETLGRARPDAEDIPSKEVGRLEADLERGRYLKALERAEQLGLAVRVRSAIRRRGTDGQWVLAPGGKGYRFVDEQAIVGSGSTLEGPKDASPLSWA